MQHVPSASGTMCESGSVPPGLVTLLREHILTGSEAMHPGHTHHTHTHTTHTTHTHTRTHTRTHTQHTTHACTHARTHAHRERRTDLQDSSSQAPDSLRVRVYSFLSSLWQALLCRFPTMLPEPHAMLPFIWWMRFPTLTLMVGESACNPLHAKTQWLIKEIWSTDYVQKDLLIMFRNNLKFKHCFKNIILRVFL